MSRFNLEDYEIVADRLARFRTDYPNARTAVELLHHWVSESGEQQSFICFARVFRDMDDREPFATGLAQEHTADRGVNLTSPLENCETSALGRALANGGYSPTGGQRPSREEMTKVAAASPRSPASSPNAPQPAAGQVPSTVAEAIGLVADSLGGEMIGEGTVPNDVVLQERRANAIRVGNKLGADSKYTGSLKPSSAKQHGMIGKLLKDCGLTGEGDALKYAHMILERTDVNGAKELTSGEASVIIDALIRDADQQAEDGKNAAKAPTEDPWA